MTTVIDPVTVPGAIRDTLTRNVAQGAVEFEYSPAGWLTQDGSPRRRDWRAYYYTPDGPCPGCVNGRVPSEKRPGNTVQCPTCKGTADPKRQQLISVTTLLDAITPKPGLPPWSEARGIEGAVHAIQRGFMEATIDPREAVERVRGLRLGADRARMDAADRGLNVHALLEAYMRSGIAPALEDHPPEHWGYIQALCRWLLKADPEPIGDSLGVEELVAHVPDGYAGRRDLRARHRGLVIGWDAKTQEKGGIYLGAHLQLGLYERAAQWCGDAPCDLLQVVVFAANGEFREMACLASDRTLDAALAFYRAVKPIDAACVSANGAERAARA